MRAAAHHMVRNLTAGMAMITCRDSLLLAMSNNLKNAFGTQLLVNKSFVTSKSKGFDLK
jgi:CCR4-NOT transcription complex subunit 1